MPNYEGLKKERTPNWTGWIDTFMRKGTPDRVYFVELYHDWEIQEQLIEMFDLDKGLDRDDPHYIHQRQIAINRFAGLDYVRAGLMNMDVQFNKASVDDTADSARDGGRSYIDEHTGPITDWDSFEKFPWPDPDNPDATKALEWYSEHLPDDMCIVSGGLAHFCEHLSWLLGYETLCYMLYDDRDLVQAIYDKLEDITIRTVKQFLKFDRVRVLWASDDMGFKTGTMLSPDDMREFILKGHKIAARMAHDAGRQYILHSCGNLETIMDDLIDDVQIDAKHSYEDTIEDVRDLKKTYGQNIGLLGGIDVDFLCRNTPDAIRQRVRETLEVCQPGGGYCLGTGNSVANYIPVDHYLAMLDEGLLYGS